MIRNDEVVDPLTFKISKTSPDSRGPWGDSMPPWPARPVRVSTYSANAHASHAHIAPAHIAAIDFDQPAPLFRRAFASQIEQASRSTGLKYIISP
jgi:hypothetical protein